MTATEFGRTPLVFSFLLSPSSFRQLAKLSESWTQQFQLLCSLKLPQQQLAHSELLSFKQLQLLSWPPFIVLAFLAQT